MFTYPIIIEPDDNDTIMVKFVDLPGATFGEDEAAALANAVDLLETVMMGYITDRQDIPAPSPAAGRKTVSPTLQGTLKLLIYQAMRDQGWRKADLARAMGVEPSQIDRLFNLRHATPVAHLEAAVLVCGRRVVVEAFAA